MDFVEALERRDHPRVKRQLACKLLVDGRARKGVLRDVSAGGIFVQTRRPLSTRDGLVVTFHPPEGPRFVLEARAPRRTHVSNSLAPHTLASAGLRLEDPPPAYLRWLEETGEEAS